MSKSTICPFRYPWSMSYSCMTLIKGEKNILVDTAFEESVSPFLKDALKKEALTVKDIDLIFNTHTHEDHIQGNSLIAGESSAKIHVHPEGRKNPLIQQLAVPVVSFSDGEKIAGCRIIFTPGHSADSVCILEESSSTLIIGDSIEGRGSAFAGIALIHDPAAYLESIKKIRELYQEGKIEKMIFSHYTNGFGDEVCGKETAAFLDASEETLYQYRMLTEKYLNIDPDISCEEMGKHLRENFSVSDQLVSPGTANGVARAFLEYCRKKK